MAEEEKTEDTSVEETDVAAVSETDEKEAVKKPAKKAAAEDAAEKEADEAGDAAEDDTGQDAEDIPPDETGQDDASADAGSSDKEPEKEPPEEKEAEAEKPDNDEPDPDDMTREEADRINAKAREATKKKPAAKKTAPDGADKPKPKKKLTRAEKVKKKAEETKAKTEKEMQENMMKVLERLSDRIDHMEENQEAALKRAFEGNVRRSELLSEGERRKEVREDMKANNIKLSGTQNFETEADKNKKEAMLLNQANKSKSRLKGKIHKISEVMGKPVVYVFEQHDTLGTFPITIPAAEFFPFDQDFSGESGRIHLMKDLDSRLGGDETTPDFCEFMLLDFNEKERVAVASRVAAMSDRAVMNFISKGEDGIPEFVPGMKTNATVIAVRDDRIKVEVHGVETSVVGRDLGYRTFNRVREYFHVGDGVMVKINKVEKTTYQGLRNIYPMVKLSVSVKDAETDTSVEAYNTYRVGDHVSGTVIAASDEGGCFVDLKNIDCKCPYPKVRNGQPLMPGVRVPVVITHMDDENHFIYGAIIQ